MDLRLNSQQRQELEAIVARPEDVRQLKRAQALLAVAEGDPVVQIARRLGVSRETIYQWVRRFRERPEALPQRLLDRPRSGRPPHPLPTTVTTHPGVVSVLAGRLWIPPCQLDDRRAAGADGVGGL